MSTPGVHALDRRDQLRRVEVEHTLRIGVVAAAGIVAGDDEHVLETERPRRKQVRLQREPVPVSAGLLEDRVGAHVQQRTRCGQRRQVQRGPLVVGDVDRVAVRRQRLNAALHRREVGPVRWAHLAGDHELPAFERLAQPAHSASFAEPPLFAPRPLASRRFTDPGCSFTPWCFAGTVVRFERPCALSRS